MSPGLLSIGSAGAVAFVARMVRESGIPVTWIRSGKGLRARACWLSDGFAPSNGVSGHEQSPVGLTFGRRTPTTACHHGATARFLQALRMFMSLTRARRDGIVA
ncbi:hypothetical protein LDL36_14540 [Komagataeibacter sp. FNDCR1]|nr:hypothetical protein [Komagataeibacter sp. FNDCR1]